MRLQILELPEAATDTRRPFALVIDEIPQSVPTAHLAEVAAEIGAAGVLLFDERVDIPSNDHTGWAGGVSVRVEPDLTGFRAQVQAEVDAAAQQVADARAGLAANLDES
ncbi:hypothetical protein [Streptomyces bohaiensis]|uniref:Uncharacterized protein n=1 Tax=Streptomyces bohaiensis TaxID=1431344 RepID=A0ABX1CAN0_9ACTN|nr:hypothetical protein [Streptomyces bohaiensis]NJQ14214.1 hypothetical protein [Streptomyces bohaiensis]